MIVRLGFLVTASIAVYAVKQISFKSSERPTSSTKCSENGDTSFKQDQTEEKEQLTDSCSTTEKKHMQMGKEEVTGISNILSSNLINPSALGDEELILPEFRDHLPGNIELLLSNEKVATIGSFQAKKDNKTYKIEKEDYGPELRQLQNQVKELEERKVKLEKKLQKSYCLKEQESGVAELRRHLKIKTVEIEMLNITINSLQAERKKLQEEISKGVLAKKQLEMANNKIKELRRQIQIDGNQMKDKVLIIKQHVTSLQSEAAAERDARVDKKVKALKSLELEVVELKRRNKEIQLEKRELTVKLIAAEAKITSLSNMKESDMVSKVMEEANSLRMVNEDLSKQVERLNKSTFCVVEDLVYLRWVNACLRHEIQNCQTPSEESAHYFSKSLSPKSQQRVKKMLLEYVRLDSRQRGADLNNICSQASSTESEEFDKTTIEISTNRQASINKKHSLIQKIKRWGKSKDDSSAVSSSSSSFGGSSSSSRNSLRRRWSMSMAPMKASMLRNAGDYDSIAPFAKEQDSTKSSETPNLRRKRRVSFNDSINTVASSYEKMSKSVERVSDEKSPVYKDQDNLALEREYPIKKDKQPKPERFTDSLNLRSSTGSQTEVEEGKPISSSLKLSQVKKVGGSRDSSEQPGDNIMVDTQVVRKTKIDHSMKCDQRKPESPSSNSSKVDAQVVHFVAVFFSLFLMLLVYYLLFLLKQLLF